MILHNARNRSIQYTLLVLFSISMVIISQLLILPSIASNVDRSVLEDDISIYAPAEFVLNGKDISIMSAGSSLIDAGQNLPTESSKTFCTFKQNKLNINLSQEKSFNSTQGKYVRSKTIFNISVDLPQSSYEPKIVFNADVDIPPRLECGLKASVFVTVDKDRLLKLKLAIPEINFTKEYGPFLIEKML